MDRLILTLSIRPPPHPGHPSGILWNPLPCICQGLHPSCWFPAPLSSPSPRSRTSTGNDTMVLPPARILSTPCLHFFLCHVSQNRYVLRVPVPILTFLPHSATNSNLADGFKHPGHLQLPSFHLFLISQCYKNFWVHVLHRTSEMSNILPFLLRHWWAFSSNINTLP